MGESCRAARGADAQRGRGSWAETVPRCRPARALPGRPPLPRPPAEAVCHRRSRSFAGLSPRAHPPQRSAARPAPAGGGSSRGKSRGWAGSGPWRRDPTPFPSRSAPRAVLPVPTLFMCGRNWDFPSACSAGRDLRAELAGTGSRERGRNAGAAGGAAASAEEDANPHTGSRCEKGTMATAGGRDGTGGGRPWRPALPGEPCHSCPASARPTTSAQVCVFPPRPDLSCQGQHRPLEGFWGEGIPSLLTPQGAGNPAVAVEAHPGARPSVRRGNLLLLLWIPETRVAAWERCCAGTDACFHLRPCDSRPKGLAGGWDTDAGPACYGREGRGNAEEPRSPSRVRVWDPPVLARSQTRASERCPAAGLTPGGAGGAGGLCMEAAGKQRCEGAMALLLLRYRAEAGSEQPAVIRADLQVGVKRALKIS